MDSRVLSLMVRDNRTKASNTEWAQGQWVGDRSFFRLYSLAYLSLAPYFSLCFYLNPVFLFIIYFLKSFVFSSFFPVLFEQGQVLFHILLCFVHFYCRFLTVGLGLKTSMCKCCCRQLFYFGVVILQFSYVLWIFFGENFHQLKCLDLEFLCCYSSFFICVVCYFCSFPGSVLPVVCPQG